jgi:polysaccharide export outer membrane protein
MVRPRLTLKFLGKLFSALVFIAAGVGALSGCNGVPGDGDGASLAPREDADTAAAAQAARAANKYASAATPGNAGYLVGPQDVLDVTVFQAPDLSKSVQVAEDGAINLPLVGQIPAAGRSASRLERDIEARLNARYLKSAQVTVFVKEYNSQRVTVEGAVRTPGVYPLRGNDTLMQVLAKSGGVNRDIASDSVIVFRNADGARTMVRFDISTIRGGAEPDPRVLPGDVVLLEESATKETLNLFLKVLPVAGTAASVAAY